MKDQNNFYEASCSDKNVCRGTCKDVQTITNLKPNTSYDIRVKSYENYGETIIRNIKTSIQK